MQCYIAMVCLYSSSTEVRKLLLVVLLPKVKICPLLCHRVLTVPRCHHVPFQTCSQYNRKSNIFFFFGGGCEQSAKYAVCSRDPQIETTIQEFIQTWLTWPLKTKDLVTIVWTFSIIFCLSQSCPAAVEDDIKLNMLFLLWGILSLSCVQMVKTVVAFPPTLFQEERVAEPPTQAWSVDSFLSESQNPGQRLQTCESLEMWLKGWDFSWPFETIKKKNVSSTF